MSASINPLRWVIFTAAFRVMFALVAIFSLAVMALWLPIWSGALALPDGQNPLFWHIHELLFGVVGAAVGGFILTAIANWTGRPPVAGVALVALASLWLVARLLGWFLPLGSGELHLAALANLGYFALLLLLAGRELLLANQRRNLPVLALIGALLLASMCFHLHSDPVWRLGATRAALMLICVLLGLIGGRITPAFTRNYLNKQQHPGARPVAFNRLDGAAMLALLLAGVSWSAAPISGVTAGLLVIAGLLQLARLSRWCGHLVVTNPLLVILHIGFAWLGVGLILLGLGAQGVIAQSAGVHALTIGAMATMIIAVASRAALGHTQRALVATRSLCWAFGFIVLAAILRVASALLPELYIPLLHSAGTCWLLAFGLFLWRYAPILLRP